ncbi:MAG: phosphate ABC transporter permease [Isosphaera sp.]|nr:phosphate ABC transporter permease [Isosphaera sp.]
MSTAPPAEPRPPARLPEVLFAALTRGAGLLIPALAALLVGVLLWDAWPVLSRPGEYHLLGSTWDPAPTGRPPMFGLLGFVFGTVVTAAIAMLIAVPLGVGTAAYLSEIAGPRVRRAATFLVELLAAIPSVVYGFWGLRFLSPRVRDFYEAVGLPDTAGLGLFPAGLVLAVMVLPYVTALSFDVCQAVPRSQREGSLSLGATRWQTVWRVVLPYARPGIIAACFLALGRALGETMAVTMLVGSRPGDSWSPFGLGDSLASGIALGVPEADSNAYRSALMAMAVVLFAVTAGFNVFARVLLRRLTRSPQPAPAATADARPAAEDFAPAAEVAPLPSDGGAAVRRDRAMTWVLRGCVFLSLVPLFLILGYILVNGVREVEGTLFTERKRTELTPDQYGQYKRWQETGRDEDYPRVGGQPALRGGLGHAMVGSVLVVLAAAAMAVPFGVLAAVYLAEARNSRTASAVRFVTEVMGGVPSIVVGLFAYACLVYPFWLGGVPWGYSGWAGAFALAVLMVPVVVRSAEEAMRLVPDSLRQASYALGATRMQTTLRVVIPSALPAIVTGVFLAVGRAAGETAPLLVTAGLYNDWRFDLSGEVGTLPLYIYKYSTSNFDDLRDQGWGAAVVLLSVVMLLNVGIRLVSGKRVVAAARAD